MRFANELKVGLAIIASAVIFMLGYRYLQDVPLLSGTSKYYSVLDDARGLISGNPVRLNGVKVGSVIDVRYSPETDSIRVDFKVGRDIPIHRGSQVEVTGIDALGGVRLDLELGPRENSVIEPGGRVRNLPRDSDLLADLTARAPGLVDKTDSVLSGLDETLSSVSGMLNDPASDLRQSLRALRSTASTLETTLREERQKIGSILGNVEQITGKVNGAIGEDDSLSIAVADLRASLASLRSMTESLGETTKRLDRITAKIDSGEGTLGRLVNDPGLYVQLDSAARNLNELLADFKARPRRYLRELKLVDIF